jgi:surface antigen
MESVRMRNTVSLTLLAALTFAIALAPETAQAQLVSPFSKEQMALNDEETQQMREALRTVLESGTPGTEKRWNNATTKRVGIAKLLRSFQKQGAKCGQVQHTLISPQKEDRNMTYTMPFCKQSDGTWKIAF